MSEAGKIAFDAYWETPSARWDEMSDMGKAKWAQAEAKIVAAFSGSHERVRHVERGTEYEVLGEAVLQIATDKNGEAAENRMMSNYSPVMVYRSVDTRELWVRPYYEFNDGRFEPA